jgi:hypothetical protein
MQRIEDASLLTVGGLYERLERGCGLVLLPGLWR